MSSVTTRALKLFCLARWRRESVTSSFLGLYKSSHDGRITERRGETVPVELIPTVSVPISFGNQFYAPRRCCAHYEGDTKGFGCSSWGELSFSGKYPLYTYWRNQDWTRVFDPKQRSLCSSRSFRCSPGNIRVDYLEITSRSINKHPWNQAELLKCPSVGPVCGPYTCTPTSIHE